MVIVILKMDVRPEKSLELKQTLLALLDSLRKENGCLNQHLYQDIENENAFSVIQMWRSQKDLDEHFQSDTFSLLIGNQYLLSRPQEITISEVSAPSGWQDLETLLRPQGRGG